jgi:hypothetical protein
MMTGTLPTITDAIRSASSFFFAILLLFVIPNIVILLKHKKDPVFTKKYLRVAVLGGLSGFIGLILFAYLTQTIEALSFSLLPLLIIILLPIATTYAISRRLYKEKPLKSIYLVGGPTAYILTIILALQIILLLA